MIDLDKIDAQFEESQQNSPKPPVPVTPSEVQEDYLYTKNKLKILIDASEEVLENTAALAAETGEPRMIEVYAQLVKNLGDLAKSVMENSKNKAITEKEKAAFIHNKHLEGGAVSGNATITNNNQTIFVGSTKELLNLIKEEETAIIEGEIVHE